MCRLVSVLTFWCSPSSDQKGLPTKRCSRLACCTRSAAPLPTHSAQDFRYHLRYQSRLSWKDRNALGSRACVRASSGSAHLHQTTVLRRPTKARRSRERRLAFFMCGVGRLESAAVQVRPVRKKVPAPGLCAAPPCLLTSVYSAASLGGGSAKRRHGHRQWRHSRSPQHDHDAPRPSPTVDAGRQRVTSPVCGGCARTGSPPLPRLGGAGAVSQHRRSNRASNSVASCRSMTKACLVCSSIPALFGALPSALRETAASGVPVYSQNTHACWRARCARQAAGKNRRKGGSPPPVRLVRLHRQGGRYALPSPASPAAR